MNLKFPAGSKPAARTIPHFSTGRATPRQTANFSLCFKPEFRNRKKVALREGLWA
jgi:hypothetical protein